MKSIYPRLLTVALVTLLTSSGQAQIKARGSDSTLHVLKALATAYAADSGKNVIVEGGGSGAGAKGLIKGEVSLAFLSRELKADEKTAGLIGYNYASDGVVIIINTTNPATNLTQAELKNIFTGQTPAWPDGKPIVLFNRNADSGTREVFQEKILGPDAFSARAMVKHDGVIISSLGKLPGAIDYTSFGEVDATKTKVLMIDGIQASATAIRDGSYPISRHPILATKGEATGEEKAFIDFVLGAKGQAIVRQTGLVPVK